MNYLEVAVLAVEVPRGLMDRITGFKLQHKIVLRSQLTLHKFIWTRKLGWEWEEKQVIRMKGKISKLIWEWEEKQVDYDENERRNN